MNSNIISSAIIAIALIVTTFIGGRYIEQYNRTQAIKVCYETSTLPYTSETGEGMYFDGEKYKACMNNMGY